MQRAGDGLRHEKLRVHRGEGETIGAIVSMIMEMARSRRKEATGAGIDNAVLQHLVGAKLELILGEGTVTHTAAGVAKHAAKAGGFLIGDSVVHVTTAPGEELVATCAEDLKHRLRPVVVCPRDNVTAVGQLIASRDLEDRIEVYSAEQFISTNVNESAKFDAAALKATTMRLVRKYNDIVREHETDQSLQIEEAE